MNPYEMQEKSPEDFLKIVYILIKKNIKLLISIEDDKVRGKLSLPLLKIKFETTSKTLEALSLMIHYLQGEVGDSMADSYATIGMHIGQGNIAENETDVSFHYQMALQILANMAEA